MNKRQQAILDTLENGVDYSSSEIFEKLDLDISLVTVKRSLKQLVELEYLDISGTGRSTRYTLNSNFSILRPLDMDAYYSKEVDDRIIIDNFNFELITELLSTCPIFNNDELSKLKKLQSQYQENISQLSPFERNKELERLAIDLSWKSSQIEGNTYSLLETELLLKEQQTAQGKTKDEAIMLLNHKKAIDFLIENTDYLNPLKVSRIEDVHSLLMTQLDVPRNIRRRRVGISGTNYVPLDNEFQIREALKAACSLINSKQNIFDKALLLLLLISYIQPFADGNKRSARIISNGVLLHFGYCPLSFRTVDSIAYKKAMLLFYEQHNISNFKNLFIEQFEFAVRTYF